MPFSFPQPLRSLLLVVVCLLSAGARVAAQAPGWQWASSPGEGVGSCTAVDAAGNVYVAGSFRGTATFGATTLLSVSGSNDVFVAKLSGNGVYQWAVRAGGAGLEYGASIAVDSSGRVVVTGGFGSQTITFGSTTLINAGGSDGFVANLTSAGVWQWAVGVGGSSIEVGYGIAVDGGSNILVTGSFGSPAVTFGSTTLTNAGGDDIYVAKLTSAGIWQWAVGVGESSDDGGTGIAVDGSGNVVITGYFASPTLTFGSTTLINAGGSDGYVANLTSAGVWRWAVGVGGIIDDYGSFVNVDDSGNTVVTGVFFNSALTFGATTLTNAEGSDVFVAKLTPTGLWQWATSVGGSGNDASNGVAIDGSGNVVVVGSFTSPAITLGATTLINTAGSDVFVAKLTSGGIWQWATSVGGSGFDHGGGVAMVGSGNILVTGQSGSPAVTFGATTLTNTNSPTPALFIASLSGTTGLPDEDNTAATSQLTLSPNPAHTTVQLTGATGATATLLDGLGRVVGTAPIGPEGTATLDVRALAPGLYLLRAGRATRRLVVE